MSFHVLIADALSPQAKEIIESQGISAVQHPKLSEDDLCQHIKNADAVLVRSGARITDRVMASAERLKVIGRAGIGVDNIDVKAASRRGIVVMNTPLSNAITTAEHSLSLLMAMARHIPAADASTRGGSWEKSRFMGVELYGKKLGLIGCGTIGSIVAELALGLKMQVVVYDPYLSPERMENLGVQGGTFEDVLGQADFISLHVPLSDQTFHLINKERFAQMKKGVRLVHCSRGGIVDERALVDALRLGHVAAAALDVFEEEPPRSDNPLLGMQNVICTPHLGASTREAQDKVAIEIAEQVASFLLTGAVKNAINRISLSASALLKLKPYIRLVEKLGYFLGQSVRSGISEIRVEYHGQAAEIDTHALTELATAAILSQRTECVNLVNARDMAQNRGISIVERLNTRSKPFQELITLSVETERACRSVSGTLFSDKSPRLVAIDDIALESSFSEYMLFIRHKDAPGMIGELGRSLAEAHVNIATLNLGRQTEGGDALALLGLDQPVCDSLLPRILKLPSINMAQCLSFKSSRVLL